MVSSGPVGRFEERTTLRKAVNSAAGGHGSLVLLSGEAGTGKTRLAVDVLENEDVRFLRAAALPADSPYGLVTGALRAFMREMPGGLDDCGPLAPKLATILPELGPAVDGVDSATLNEAIRCAFESIARDRPTAILFDDLQWSDEATLELLSGLASWLPEAPLLIVGAYRSDELQGPHSLKNLRADLRRDRLLTEIAIEPLSEREVAELVEQLLGGSVSPRLVSTVLSRTGGNAFFVEELTLALESADRLVDGDEGIELSLDADLPLPATIRDAVLVRLAPLPDAARAAAEAAAAAGYRFDLGVLAEIAPRDGISQLLEAGVLVEERDSGWAAFRHPLTRDAIYEDVPWLRRSELHRRIAELLEPSNGDRAEVAAHWLAARDTTRALDALLAAISDRARINANRDAARIGREALAIWPEGERGEERLEMLAAHAVHAELAGDLPEAARAQREVVSARRVEGAGRALADAERRIASIYAMQGDRPRALAARRVAAEAFASNGLPGEAAAERLVIAGYLQSAGELREAASVAAAARAEALRAERVDLRARAMGLEGVATVKRGNFEEGIAIVREGLSLALEHELTAETAEVYQRLGTAREIAGDYQGAADALGTALGICEADGGGDLEQVCLACLAYVLRELGDWDEVETLCRRLITPGASADDTLVADGVLGAIEAWRGRGDAAIELLLRCHETAVRLDVVSMQCDSAAALAWLFAANGDDERAYEYCRMLLDRWERSEDHHYAVWGLRWACGWLAQNGHLETARACAGALSTLVASAGYPDAMAALAYALGETAMAEGDVETAADQLVRASELHESLYIPFERANIQLRTGEALVATGQGERAVDYFVDAHRTARELGASALAATAGDHVASLGVSLEEHLGVRAADEHARAGLSKREHEVVRLVAEGLTNREIADRLVLSTRTVDAHLRSILSKLDCRTRTEAATRAADLGLLDDVPA